METKYRCKWADKSDILRSYHDLEWGKVLEDDQKLFEFILLDTFQAGLSWEIVLKKREGMRKHFKNFDPNLLAELDSIELEELYTCADIIRNRLKINAVKTNAIAFLKIQNEFGTFSKYIWQFSDYKIINNSITNIRTIQSRSSESDAMSKDLKKRGFKFVGTTICYAFMQAIGMINDHEDSCAWK